MKISTDNTIPIEERLWGRVRYSGDCWMYSGPITADGYGFLSYLNKRWLAHRLAWHMTNGPIPEGMLVCHHCDIRPCINPAHLYVGTYADNNRDTRTRGRHGCGRRHLHGELNGHAKLTAEQVMAIRQRRLAGEQYDLLAEEYGVTRWTIGDIERGKSWQHLPILRTDVGRAAR